jgi:hypothetical protein
MGFPEVTTPRQRLCGYSPKDLINLTSVRCSGLDIMLVKTQQQNVRYQLEIGDWRTREGRPTQALALRSTGVDNLGRNSTKINELVI